MTGDHGGSDFPERLAQQGYPGAKRISGASFLASVNAELKQKFSFAYDPLKAPDTTQLYAVDDKGLAPSEPLRTQVIDRRRSRFLIAARKSKKHFHCRTSSSIKSLAARCLTFPCATAMRRA
jgi:hypothetical protein